MSREKKLERNALVMEIVTSIREVTELHEQGKVSREFVNDMHLSGILALLSLMAMVYVDDDVEGDEV